MAPKREKSLLEDPPAASSSEDEEVEEEEEVEDEEEEEEEEEEDDEEEEAEDDDEEEEAKGKPNSSSAVKKPLSDLTPNLGSKPQIPSSDDEEEEEDESEESDSEPIPSKVKPLVPSRGSNPNGGKPIASQPKKTVSKPSTTATTPLASSPTKPSVTGKRPLESEKDSKRKKKKVDDEDEEDSHPEESEKRSPKNIFQRLWSEDDEIVILRGMVESLKKGVKPLSDRSEFLESIKNSLHVEVSQDQLTNKIRRLKKKYLNNFKRGKGGDPVFSKSHDVLSYELMKEIWGAKEGEIRGGETSNGRVDSVVANGKSSKSKKSNNAVIPVRTKTLSLSDISMRESSKLDGSNGSLHPCVQEMVHSRNNMNMVGGSFLTQGLSLIGDSKTKELEQKWRSLYAAELQLYLRRVELVQEQTIAIVDAFKSSEEH